MNSTASSSRSEPFGTVTMSPPAKEAVWPDSSPGSRATLRSMSGFCCFARNTLKLPVPMIPVLPEPKTLAKVSPFSAWAAGSMRPSWCIIRAHSSTVGMLSPTSASSPHSAGSIVPPEAQINGAKVKMLHPEQLPAR